MDRAVDYSFSSCDCLNKRSGSGRKLGLRFLEGVPIALNDLFHLLRGPFFRSSGKNSLLIKMTDYINEARSALIHAVDSPDSALLSKVRDKIVTLTLESIRHGSCNLPFGFFVLHCLPGSVFDLPAFHLSQEGFHRKIHESIRCAR